MLKTEHLFDLSHSIVGELLGQFTYPWQALPHIKSWVLDIGKTLDKAEYEEISPLVFVAKSATVAPSACIEGPAIIGPNSKIGHCAYIRHNVIIGAGVTVGNSTEVKNAILFDGVQVPHFNYVGDSILGYYAHLGGGALLSNFRSDHGVITVRGEGEAFDTGMNKVGAMIGDFAEIGAGAVLNPGTVIGKEAVVYPLSSVRGVVPPRTIYKKAGEVVARRMSEEGKA